MNQKQSVHLVSGSIAVGGGVILSATLWYLYNQSNYLPFLLGAICLLLPGVVNLILLLFCRDVTIPASFDAGASKNTEGGEPMTSNGSKLKRFGMQVLSILKSIIRWLLTGYNRIRMILELLLLLTATVGGGILFGIYAFSTPKASNLQYWHLVVLVALFVLTVVLDKYCKHSNEAKGLFLSLLKNARAFFNVAKILLFGMALAVALVMLNIYDIQLYLIYAIIAITYYAFAMTLLSLSVRTLRKELSTAPTVVIWLPFLATDSEELSVISFLEENTGITLRSLWSLRYLRKMLPVAIVCTFALFWIATGIVYVESHQEAVVYRFGVMQEETLKPGLHLNLPYPFDKTEIYNTETVNKITIGYKSEENVDNVWTAGHGDSEYKLLLGSGNELVSLNLRIEYKIDDLKEYLRTSSQPDRIIEAKAYELTTHCTINTDLETLLSVDREAFANQFCQELAQSVNDTQTGIEVVSVIMESIHPPVEVAEVYQKFIAVEIDAERIITEAEGAAAVLLAQAQSRESILLGDANSFYFDQIAGAKYEVAEFMSAVAAYDSYPNEYAYYKYLEAICSAYENAKLVILGEGVDGSRIIWGSFVSDGE